MVDVGRCDPAGGFVGSAALRLDFEVYDPESAGTSMIAEK